jgi:hypothetical protein
VKKIMFATITAAALCLPFAGSIFAGSPNHAAPGTPGDANCVGQTTAALAQGLDGETGIGNVAAANNLSVKEVKQLIQDYCAL